MPGIIAQHIATAALWPFSLGYGLAVGLRNLLYDRSLIRSAAVGVPVVSVGNITAGGTGKTPFAIMLAEMLSRSGRRVAVISRGYRGKRKCCGPLLVSDGFGLKTTAEEAGDEAYLMAGRLLGVGAMVIVCPDRIRAATLAEGLGAGVIILDDGFQHRRIERDVDIVLLDQQRPLDNGRLLPAGMLRESPKSLGRADAVVLTRCLGDGVPQSLRILLRAEAPIFMARHVMESVSKIDEWRIGKNGGMHVSRGKWLLFSGLANPQSFEASVLEAGGEIGGHLKFPDHHTYRAWDLAKIEKAGQGMEAIVTTEKDAVRLPNGWNPGGKLMVLKVSLKLLPDRAAGDLEKFITERISG
jgi:tetraacyldisaccharide 4'-kinase